MSSLVKLKVSIKTVTTGDFISLHPDDSHSLFHGLPTTGHFCRVLKVSPFPTTIGQYVGWAGHSATNKGTVEVSKPFASALGWVEGQLVELSGVDKIPKNTEPIVIRPCSSDDWEVVELQAEYLESALLSQIAVLYPGLKFPLWPEGGGKPIFMEAVWDAADSQANSVPFRLLSDSDELAIEARPRRLLVPDSSADVKRLCRIVCDGNVFPKDLYDKFAVTCVLHQTTGVTTGVVQLGESIMAPCVVNNDLVDPGYVLLHPLLAVHYPDVIQEAAPVLVTACTKEPVLPSEITLVTAIYSGDICSVFTDTLRRLKCLVAQNDGWIRLNRPPGTGGLSNGKAHNHLGPGPAGSPVLLVDEGMSLELEYPDDERSMVETCHQSDWIDVKVTFPEQAASDLCLVMPQMLSNAGGAGNVRLSAKVDGSVAITAEPRNPIRSFIPVEASSVVKTYRTCRACERPPMSLEKISNEISSFISAAVSGRVPASLPVPSIMVTGPSGCGKSTVAHYAVRDLGYTVVDVDCAQLASAERFKFTVVKKALFGALKFACTYDPPSVLLLDGVDVLLGLRPPQQQGSGGPTSVSQNRSKVLASIFRDALELHLRPTRSMVILSTAESVTGLEALGCSCISLPATLNVKDRLAILGSDRGEGYSLKEVSVLARTGVDLRDRRRAEDQDRTTTAEYELSHLGGRSIRQAADKLMDAIQLPLKYPSLCGGVLVPKGAMLVGPPGCGKTALAMAVAKECGLPVVAVRGPELLSKYIGGSEARVRETFAKARSRAPCILFFDEVDALCPVRGADSTGVTDRVVNQMLTYLDGVEVSDSPVFVVAASSRPDMVDPALSRPGRLDLSLLCDLPSGHTDLVDVLEQAVHGFEDLEAVLATAPPGWSDELIGLLSSEAGFTGADIRAALATAQLSIDEDGEEGWDALKEAFAHQSPSAPTNVLKKYMAQFAAYRRGQGSHDDTDDPYHHHHLASALDSVAERDGRRGPGSRVALA